MLIDSLSGDSTLTLGKSAPFLPHERAKMPHECPRFHVMSTGSHNRHSLFWVKGLQLFFELILPGATFHLTFTKKRANPSPIRMNFGFKVRYKGRRNDTRTIKARKRAGDEGGETFRPPVSFDTEKQVFMLLMPRGRIFLEHKG